MRIVFVSLAMLVIPWSAADKSAGCDDWKSLCGKDIHYSPRRRTTNHLKKRKQFNPQYVLDTSFRVIDGEQQSKWIVQIGGHSASMGSKLADVFVAQTVKSLPWGDAISFGKDILGAAGIDLGFSHDDQPIMLDMTNLVNKLKADLKDWTQQKMFNDTLNDLKSVYTTYSKYLKSVENYTGDYTSILENLPAIIDPLYAAFTRDIAREDYADKYALYLLGPMLSHISLHYTAALFRSSAQSDLYQQSPKRNPSLMHTACQDLVTFNDTMTEYYTWFVKYTKNAFSQRTDDKFVSRAPTCSGTCKSDDRGGYSTREVTVQYSWEDLWPGVNMSKHTEQYKQSDSCHFIISGAPNYIQLSGVDTGNGSALHAEIVNYKQDMKLQLRGYLDKMNTTMLSMVNQTTTLANKCAFKEFRYGAPPVTWVV